MLQHNREEIVFFVVRAFRNSGFLVLNYRRATCQFILSKGFTSFSNALKPVIKAGVSSRQSGGHRFSGENSPKFGVRKNP